MSGVFDVDLPREGLNRATTATNPADRWIEAKRSLETAVRRRDRQGDTVDPAIKSDERFL